MKLQAIRSNDDVRRYRTARRILEGEHLWLEAGLVPQPELSRPPYAEAEPPKPEEKKRASL